MKIIHMHCDTISKIYKNPASCLRQNDFQLDLINQIKPADLLYFPGHVALYLGNHRYIHCTGNPKSFGCVINSLCPKDKDYRRDLAENLVAVGSAF